MEHHKHHIIPKHEWKERFGTLEGVDSPDNICYLTLEQHIECHRWLYENYKRWEDKCAYLFLSGRMDKQDLYKEWGRVIGKANAGRSRTKEWRLEASKRNSGKGNPNYGNKYSIESKYKISLKRFGRSYVVRNKIWVIVGDGNCVIRTQNIAEFCRNNNLKPSGISWAYHNNKSYMGYRVTREVL